MSRPHSEALDGILEYAYPVLDHGFVRVIDYMGDESAIVQAARVSYGAGTKTVREDRALIRYLMRNHHSSPMEMASIKLHVKLPIFIARQWIRYRTAKTNEVSARYSVMPQEFYIPPPELIAVQSSDNKQGRGEPVSPYDAGRIQRLLRAGSEEQRELYELLLNIDDDGRQVSPADPMLARELARIGLTLNTYTEWYWKIDLHNLLHFLAQRLDSHAQAEFRAYAQVIAGMVQTWVPEVWLAFQDYRLEAVTFSRQEVAELRALLARIPAEERERAVAGLEGESLRERRAFAGFLGL
jgi:thymidylate synthase (FAD)